MIYETSKALLSFPNSTGGGVEAFVGELRFKWEPITIDKGVSSDPDFLLLLRMHKVLTVFHLYLVHTVGLIWVMIRRRTDTTYNLIMPR